MGIGMRTVLIIFWGIVLLVFTCASDSGFWVSGTIPTFHLSAPPDFHNLLTLDIRYTSTWIIRKIGHFSGFAILAVLLYRKNKSALKSILFSIGFALLTELLQLYFGRDGRLYDVAIDSAGVLLGAMAAQIIYKFRFDRNLSNAN